MYFSTLKKTLIALTFISALTACNQIESSVSETQIQENKRLAILCMAHLRTSRKNCIYKPKIC